MPGSGAFILSDGGTLSLLACASAADGRSGAGGGPVVIRTYSWASELQRRAVERQAELLGLSVVGSIAKPEPAPQGGRGSARAPLELLDAAFEAASTGAGLVIWPEGAGPELDVRSVGRAVDRAMLISRLVAVEVGETAPEVRAPYADFTDAQVADLVLDMDLPIWTCWWWGLQSPEAGAERDRWLTALRAAGWAGDLPLIEVRGRDRVNKASGSV